MRTADCGGGTWCLWRHLRHGGANLKLARQGLVQRSSCDLTGVPGLGTSASRARRALIGTVRGLRAWGLCLDSPEGCCDVDSACPQGLRMAGPMLACPSEPLQGEENVPE